MRKGLLDVLPKNSLEDLTAEDFRLLVNGCGEVNVQMLISFTSFNDESGRIFCCCLLNKWDRTSGPSWFRSLQLTDYIAWRLFCRVGSKTHKDKQVANKHVANAGRMKRSGDNPPRVAVFFFQCLICCRSFFWKSLIGLYIKHWQLWVHYEGIIIIDNYT